jgi:hypothetical protein
MEEFKFWSLVLVVKNFLPQSKIKTLHDSHEEE